MDLRTPNSIIYRLDRRRYNLFKDKHRFKINRYRKLQNMHKHIIGCWKCDFDKILLTNCKYRSRIWIYRWTHWSTLWQPAHSRRVQTIPSNSTWVDSLGLWMSRSAMLATVRFGHFPRPKVMVRNHCQHYQRCKTNHCAGSIDTHYEDWAWSVPLLLLPLKVAKASCMDVCNQSPVR